MAKLGQAQEPSMEEILASIRRIISDEDTAARSASPRLSVVDTQPREAAHLMTAQQSEPEPLPDAGQPAPLRDDGVFQLSEAQAASPEDEEEVSFAETMPAAPPLPPKSPEPELRRVAPSPEPQQAPEQPPGRHLLSQRADEAVHTAFNQLAATFLSNQARTLEDLVKEMMRPMLKSWLDDNLPPLVERLVRDEIERVSRGRR